MMQLNVETDVKILYVVYTPSWGRSWAGAVIITYINCEKLDAMSVLTRPLIEEMKPLVRTRIDENTIKCLEIRRGIDIEAFVTRVQSVLTESDYNVTVIS